MQCLNRCISMNLTSEVKTVSLLELKGIMVKNIDNIADRGEKLELLVDKTEELNANAVSFKKSSRGLARSLWLKNIKITVILIVVVIVIIYFIVSAACGGLDWPCTKSS